MLGAILRASSRVISFAAGRRPGSSSKQNIRKQLAVVVAHDKAGGLFVDRPWRREAARTQNRLRFLTKIKVLN
jgi:hypothetical protein